VTRHREERADSTHQEGEKRRKKNRPHRSPGKKGKGRKKRSDAIFKPSKVSGKREVPAFWPLHTKKEEKSGSNGLHSKSPFCTEEQGTVDPYEH